MIIVKAGVGQSYPSLGKYLPKPDCRRRRRLMIAAQWVETDARIVEVLGKGGPDIQVDVVCVRSVRQIADLDDELDAFVDELLVKVSDDVDCDVRVLGVWRSRPLGIRHDPEFPRFCPSVRSECQGYEGCRPKGRSPGSCIVFDFAVHSFPLVEG